METLGSLRGRESVRVEGMDSGFGEARGAWIKRRGLVL